MITMEQIMNASEEELRALLEENQREFDEICPALHSAISDLSGTDMDEFERRSVKVKKLTEEFTRNGQEARALIHRMNELGLLRDKG